LSDCRQWIEPYLFADEGLAGRSPNIFFLDNRSSLFFIDFQFSRFFYFLFVFFFYTGLFCSTKAWVDRAGACGAPLPIQSVLLRCKLSRGLEAKGVCRPSK